MITKWYTGPCRRGILGPMTKLLVLTTGGTIACTTGPDGALIPTVSGADLVASVARRFDPAATSFLVRELTRLDSSSITLSDVDELIAAVHHGLADPTVTGIIVTHGTDSLEESAIAVDCFHADPRPVVFTGAMRPFDHPDPDGPDNLFDAAVIAADPASRGIGALLVFGHAVLPARGATKRHTSELAGFASNTADPARPAALPVAPLAGIAVEIIPAYPGAAGAMVQAALDRGARGLVVEALGAGNVGSALGDALGSALDDGIPVIISTRVPAGEVSGTYGGAGGGATLAAKGAIGSGYLRAGQSRMLLAAALATGTDPARVF